MLTKSLIPCMSQPEEDAHENYTHLVKSMYVNCHTSFPGLLIPYPTVVILVNTSAKASKN